MGISLKPKHLKRYKDIAALLIKHGRSDLVRNVGLDTLDVEPDTATPQASKADELARDLERLGPTFVKLGQLLSTRVDLLPTAYTQALSRLQDKLEPFPFDEVETIIAGELGVRLSKAFAEFNAEPMAAASLGQLHQATLRDGRRVLHVVNRLLYKQYSVPMREAGENLLRPLPYETPPQMTEHDDIENVGTVFTRGDRKRVAQFCGEIGVHDRSSPHSSETHLTEKVHLGRLNRLTEHRAAEDVFR